MIKKFISALLVLSLTSTAFAQHLPVAPYALERKNRQSVNKIDNLRVVKHVPIELINETRTQPPKKPKTDAPIQNSVNILENLALSQNDIELQNAKLAKSFTNASKEKQKEFLKAFNQKYEPDHVFYYGKYRNIAVQYDENGSIYVEGQLTVISPMEGGPTKILNPVFYALAFNHDSAPFPVQWKAELENFINILINTENNANHTKLLKTAANEFIDTAINALKYGTMEDKIYIMSFLYDYILNPDTENPAGMFITPFLTQAKRAAIIYELKKISAITKCDHSFVAKQKGVEQKNSTRYIAMAMRRPTFSNSYAIMERRGTSTREYIDEVFAFMQNTFDPEASAWGDKQQVFSLLDGYNLEGTIGSPGVLCMGSGLASYTLALAGEKDLLQLYRELGDEYGNDHANTIRGFFTLQAIVSTTTQGKTVENITLMQARKAIQNLDEAIRVLIKKYNLGRSSWDGFLETDRYSSLGEGYVLINRAFNLVNNLSGRDQNSAMIVLRKYMNADFPKDKTTFKYSEKFHPSAKTAALVNYASIYAQNLRKEYPDYEYKMSRYYITTDKDTNSPMILRIKGLPEVEAKRLHQLLNDLYFRLYTMYVNVEGNQKQVAKAKQQIHAVMSQLTGNTAGVIGIEPSKLGKKKLPQREKPSQDTMITDFGHQYHYRYNAAENLYKTSTSIEDVTNESFLFAFDFIVSISAIIANVMQGNGGNMYKEAKKNINSLLESEPDPSFNRYPDMPARENRNYTAPAQNSFELYKYNNILNNVKLQNTFNFSQPQTQQKK
ncbi:hypothetical protein Emin_0503 [Elusimicrobium minutum Pei191]|uniref:Uncharacterized protein n=1 Tax=Elusimicrobium minutum (strain Pei191) TaxID=445932 RepID=B2KCD8_ELUMP|nr:hypothetical protein [Elusimicrobium minutum]ACC98059.1 hypothetical protein Emin_0503 [Elusimicrobium minutum Pei191]